MYHGGLAKRFTARTLELQNSEERRRAERLWNNVIALCRPDLPLIRHDTGYRSQDLDTGLKKGLRMHTSKPVAAVNLGADGLQSLMLTEALDWFDYGMPPEDKELEKVREVEQWTEDCRDYFSGLLSESNFYSIQTGVFEDELTLGNALVFHNFNDTLEGPEYLHFNLHNVYWKCDLKGRSEEVHRWFVLTAAEASRMFDRTKLSKRCNEALGGDALREFKFWHCMVRSDDPILSGTGISSKEPFLCVYFEDGSEKHNDGDGVLRWDAYGHRPYTNWRYRARGQNSIGFGPAGLNETSLESLHLAHMDAQIKSQREARPPITAPEDMMGRIHRNPDGISWMDGPDQVVRELYQSRGFSLGLELLQMKNNEFEEVMELGMLLMITRQEREMSATEWVGRQRERALLMGPRVRRAVVDYLAPTHDILWDHALRRGEGPLNIDEIPAILLDQSRSLKTILRYKGPLVMAQKAAYGARRVAEGMEMGAPILDRWPHAADNVDADYLFRESLRDVWPAKGFVPEELVDEVRLQRRQEHAMLMDSEIGKRDADAVSKIAKVGAG